MTIKKKRRDKRFYRFLVFTLGNISGENSYYIYGHSKKLKEMGERSKNENKTKEH